MSKRKSDSFYWNTAWRRYREAYLRSDPERQLCAECRRRGMLRAGTVVDHVVPRSAGGDDFPGFEGLQTLCVRHHNAKSGREAWIGTRSTS